jgi:hypothetical protein
MGPSGRMRLSFPFCPDSQAVGHWLTVTTDTQSTSQGRCERFACGSVVGRGVWTCIACDDMPVTRLMITASPYLDGSILD